MRKVVSFLIFALFSACMSHQTLTLHDTFEEKETTASLASQPMLHMGHQPHRQHTKVVFETYDYFQGKHWASSNTNHIELKMTKQGTEISLCAAHSEWVEYKFYHTDIRKHALLCIEAAWCKEDAEEPFDIEIGLREGKKAVCWAGSFYLSHEQGAQKHCFDLRDFLYRHSELHPSRISGVVFRIQTKEHPPVSGCFVVSQIGFGKP
jgi:hypothetical protein